MTGPNVQVPVSMIESHVAWLDDSGFFATAKRWRALLSPPTPTAEPPATYEQGYDDGYLAGEHAVRNAATLQPAEPPRIEDMPPGTTPCADPNVNRWYCQRRRDGTCALPKCVDPSTARDVTAPKGDDRG